MKNRLEALVLLGVIHFAAWAVGIRVVRIKTFRVVRQALRVKRKEDGASLTEALDRAGELGYEQVVVTVVHGRFAVLPASRATAHSYQ